jgi:hypothetical protein
MFQKVLHVSAKLPSYQRAIKYSQNIWPKHAVLFKTIQDRQCTYNMILRCVWVLRRTGTCMLVRVAFLIHRMRYVVT